MNPLIALGMRALFAVLKDAPDAQHDVDGAPTNFGKAMAALSHFENVCLGLFGDYETHAASMSVAVPPPVAS